MKKETILFIALSAVYLFAGLPRQIYIGVVDASGNPFNFSGAPYDNVVFSGWITARPTEVQHQLEFGAYYETFGMGVSAVSLNIGNFTTAWLPGDELNMYILDESNLNDAQWRWTIDISTDPILVGLDDWMGAGVSTTTPYSPITLGYNSIGNTLIPNEFKLHQNYPNPFNPATAIKYDLAENSNVKLNVYNYNGQLVKSLVNGTMNAGFHAVNFDASSLSAGVYYYTMETAGKSMTQKMILVK